MSNISMIQRMEELQEEMHKSVEWMMNRNPKLEYKDCVTCYFLMQLAIIDGKLNDLKKELLLHNVI